MFQVQYIGTFIHENSSKGCNLPKRNSDTSVVSDVFIPYELLTF